MSSDKIVLTALFNTNASEVWTFLTEERHLAQWFGPHIKLDARLGGFMEERWKRGEQTVITSGTIDCFEAPVRLEMTWADFDWPAITRVTIELEPYKTGTKLKLIHAGWTDALGDDHHALKRNHQQGWAGHLRALTSYVAQLKR